MGNGDSSYNLRHMKDRTRRVLLDPDFAEFNVVIPEINMDIDFSLIPKYQAEENDKLLPTQIHPSYPFGNPAIRPRPHSGPYILQGREPLTYPRDPSISSYSPSMSLPEPERHWLELAIHDLMEEDTRKVDMNKEDNMNRMEVEGGDETRTGGPAVPVEDSDADGDPGSPQGESSESEGEVAESD